MLQILLINQKTGRSINVMINRFRVIAIIFLISALFVGCFIFAYSLAGHGLEQNKISRKTFKHWNEVIETQEQSLAKLDQYLTDNLNVLSQQVGQLQGELMLTQSLARLYFEDDEFVTGLDFNEIIGVENITDSESSLNEANLNDHDLQSLHDNDGLLLSEPTLTSMIHSLRQRINENREALKFLEEKNWSSELDDSRSLSGIPIDEGWFSSSFGWRTDPFSGNRAWHPGIDYAGRHGSPVYSIGAGVVVTSEKRGGYGKMIEIEHGGLKTRYAHNSENLVSVGDIVTKGQEIAKMGTTGRSTGPHVHLEVLIDNKQVNPMKHIDN